MIYKNINLSVLFFVVPVLLIFLYTGFIRKKRMFAEFININMRHKMAPSISYTRRFWKKLLLLLGFCFIIISLIRPQYGTHYEKITRKGLNILIALDTSASMLAKDTEPSRFEHAKQEIHGLIESLTGDRIGLIAFSGTSFVQCPLTLDYYTVKLFLNELFPGVIPQPGTNISHAIKTAVKSFPKNDTSQKIIILISDGEYFEGTPVKTAKTAARNGVRIYTIGIGSEEGEPIPVKDENNISSLKKDIQGNIVLSRLNTEILNKIAVTTGGKFFKVNKNNFVMENIYKDISLFEKQTLEEQSYKKYKDKYQYFLIFAFFLLLIEFTLSERKHVKMSWSGRI
ncbi:MAG: VWA domain-containing protein [bacterium]|nr:VWA domain-containing protein [bacterium]